MVENQAYLFLVFTITGVILGVLFDFFRVLRKTYKTSDLITYIEDIIYWILTGIIILFNIWYFNNGEIRVFIIIGIVMGALIYALTLSNLFIKINYFIMTKIKAIISFLYKIFEIPIKILLNLFKKATKLLKKLKKSINFGNKKGKIETNGE